jgi:hypothetical protein
MKTYSEFELTEDHIKLLQRMYVTWYDGEFGAPGIDCKRPYGNSDVYRDMNKILGYDDNLTLTLLQMEIPTTYLRKLHEELEIALQIVLRTKLFVPGLYRAEYPTVDWKLVN